MKVILSRKGFDSENGKIPSVFMPNGDVVSFPIPSPEKLRYSDLKYGHDSLAKIISDLIGRRGDGHCHLDPDIEISRHSHKPSNWVPGFGQCSSSLGYLKNTVVVEPGDLFLFFGWFRAAEKVGESYRYMKGRDDFYLSNDLHVIWGYLQVGEIISDFKRKVKLLPWHPHSAACRAGDPSDTIFVARKYLSFAPSRPGAGLLPFSRSRVLTMEGASKATWKPNQVYMPANVIGNRKNSAKGDGVYYSGIWQELGLKETKVAERWARDIILARRELLFSGV